MVLRTTRNCLHLHLRWHKISTSCVCLTDKIDRDFLITADNNLAAIPNSFQESHLLVKACFISKTTQALKMREFEGTERPIEGETRACE